MSQFDFGTIDPFVVNGEQLADMLNNWRDAVHTMHRGGSRPSYAVPGLVWIDDNAGPTGWIMKQYMGGGIDLPIMVINSTTGVATLASTMLATTPASPTDDSQLIATTAWVNDAIAAGIAASVATLLPVGSILNLSGKLTTAPTGWILAMQGTIGNAASGATILAHADAANLFAHQWTLPNAQAPVSGGRGASAAADFAAAKTIGGFDLRGRGIITSDDNGGTAAGIVTGGTHGVIGGAQSFALSVAQLPDHSHQTVGGNNPPLVGNTGRFTFGDGTAVSNVNTVITNGASNAAISLIQPIRAATTLIRL